MGSTQPKPGARPVRRRRPAPKRAHPAVPKAADDPSAIDEGATSLRPAAQGGGGSFGRGPSDDDDGNRRPERPDDDARPLLVAALAVLVAGASVMTLRFLTTKAPRR